MTIKLKPFANGNPLRLGLDGQAVAWISNDHWLIRVALTDLGGTSSADPLPELRAALRALKLPEAADFLTPDHIAAVIRVPASLTCYTRTNVLIDLCARNARDRIIRGKSLARRYDGPVSAWLDETYMRLLGHPEHIYGPADLEPGRSAPFADIDTCPDWVLMSLTGLETPPEPTPELPDLEPTS